LINNIFICYYIIYLFILFFSELFCELCPAVSIVGSVVVQVALNSVMKNPEMTDLYQHYNIFFYDHVQCGGNFCLFRPQSSK